MEIVQTSGTGVGQGDKLEGGGAEGEGGVVRAGQGVTVHWSGCH